MKRHFIPLLSCLLVISFLRGALSAEKKHQNEEVLATVNGKKITQADLANRLETFRNTEAETLNTIKQEILDQLITDILLEEFIDKQGLVVAPEEIEREVNQIRSNITGNQKDSGQSLEKVLAAIGSNIGEFKRSIKHSLALGKYFNNKIDDRTLEKYYDGNKSLFNGESVKVSHILIDTRDMKTQEELSHALEQIKSIKKEIDLGAAFDEMAKKYSNCPSAQNGGDLGFIQRKGNLAKSFSDAAFSLRIGQVSEPVQTEYGYHLIKVTEKKEGANVKFGDVKEKVKLAVLDEETLKLLSQLHKAAQIVINQ
ncbi:MAG: peptidylprolyl isomerase [Planctomycetes bacterium]|uniref:peptidylprolyl isomerase n=1 Tax=Candidatus Wunengus sp. YC65 TaxID=3367701 RepID=UPI001E19DC9D|nr:peptidylprolyl isomerase [Planctomycetota bacterium]